MKLLKTAKGKWIADSVEILPTLYRLSVGQGTFDLPFSVVGLGSVKTVEPPPGELAHYDYIGDSWVKNDSGVEADVVLLNVRREEICAQIEKIRDERLKRFAYDFGEPGVLHLQLRDVEDRTNWLVLDNTAIKAVLTGQSGAMLPLRTEENVTLNRTAVQVMQILSAMAIYGSTVMTVSWALKDVVRQAADPNSIDINQGWPS